MRRYVIAIGVGKYDDPTLNLPRAEADALDVQTWFVGQGAAPATGELADLIRSPTVNAVTRGLREFFLAREPDDLVVVYLACHGEVERSKVHLFGSDTPRENLAGASIAPETVGAIIGGSSVHNLLVIVDACVAGPICRAIQYAAEQAAEDGNKRDPHRPHMQAVIASTFGRAAAVDGAFAKAFLRVVADERWTGTVTEAVGIDQLVAGINEELGPQVADRRVWGPGVAALIPNPNFAKRRFGSLVAEGDLERHFDPSARGVGSASEKGFFFTGRVAEQRRIASWLSSPTVPADAASRLLVITGQPGSGKSALISRIVVASNRELRSSLLTATVPDPTTLPAEGALDRLVWCRHKTTAHVIGEIATALGGAATTLESLVALAQGRSATIAIDALDEATEAHRIAVDVIRPLTQRTQLRLLIATRRRAVAHREGDDLLDSMGAELEQILDIDASESLAADMTAYTEARLRARRVPEASIGALAKRIASAAGNSFLVAAIASRYALPEDDHELPREAGSALAAYIERLSEPARHSAVLRALAYAQGDGLPWAPLWPKVATALARLRGDQHVYGDEDIRRALDEASDLVVESTRSGRSEYRLFHEALAEHLRGGRERDDGPKNHSAIADVFIGRNRDLAWPEVDAYVQAALPLHLLEAGRFDELYAVVGDPSWERTRRIEANDPLAAVPMVEDAISRMRAIDPLDVRAIVLCVLYSGSSAVAPPPLIDVLARSGQLPRARAMAHNLTAAFDRVWAFSALARGYGMAGRSAVARQCLDEAAQSIEAMPAAHRPMAHTWVVQGAMAARHAAVASTHARLSQASLAAIEGDEWAIPNALFWTGLAARAAGDASLVAEARDAVDKRLRGQGGLRNQSLQAAAVTGHRQMLAEIWAEFSHTSRSTVRPGNLALALVDAGMKQEAEALFASFTGGRPSGEPDSIKRWAWALALAGQPHRAMEALAWIGDPLERARAIPLIVDTLASSQSSEALLELPPVIESELSSHPSSLGIRQRALLIRALYVAGGTRRALELSESLIASVPDLGPDSLDQPWLANPKAAGRGKSGRRAMVSKFALVPDVGLAEQISMQAGRGEITAAREILSRMNVPSFRARAARCIARSDPDAASSLSTWGDAMVAARAAGSGEAEDALQDGLALLRRHGRDSIANAIERRVEPARKSWFVERFAEEYATVRGTLGSSVQRTRMFTSLLYTVERQANVWTKDELVAIWNTGDDGKRIYVLAVLRTNPDLASGALLVDGVRTSRSAFEQYHALAVAASSRLVPDDVALVTGAIEAELRGEPRPDGVISNLSASSDRQRLARDFLANAAACAHASFSSTARPSVTRKLEPPPESPS